MNRMHSLLPLNLQEEHVKEVLDSVRLRHEPHKVFPIGNRSAVVDFFLPGQNLVIECWLSRSRRGVALGWGERNATYVDFKFRRLKESYLGLRCLGLVELFQVDIDSVREVVGPIMVHADFMAYTLMDFADVLGNLVSDDLGRLDRMDR